MDLRNTLVRALAVVAAAQLMFGCGGGASTESIPQTSNNVSSSSYNGPPPSTADVQAFKLNVWDNLVAENRCGNCHGTGGEVPEFVRNDDINLAYAAANTVVDLTNPGNSTMVTKVGGGHNCWLPSNVACADIVTTYINGWAGAVGANTGTQIVLVAPPERDPGASKNFDVGDPSGFDTYLWQLLKDNCAECHAEDSNAAQSPFFASSTLQTAYDFARPKIDLNTPANSRLVVRLRDEFHNCWTDCASDAQTMQTQIELLAGTITPINVDPSLVTSKALKLTEGIVASSGGRYETHQIALWQFKTGTGDMAFDTSGVNPALDLRLIQGGGSVDWVGGWGLSFKGGWALGTSNASRKLYDLITATGEYSIEGWVAPGNVTQEDANILSYSGNDTNRNFTLGQTLYNYDFYARSSVIDDANGSPALSTADADEDLQATLQHVVVTFDPVSGRRIYVNGVFTDDLDSGGGLLNNWSSNFAFLIGNEATGNRPWQGVVRMAAIHNRKLTDEQIQQNFAIGVGEKYFLLFGISHLINVPQSYVVFEVSQFDSYSYLFSAPFYVSLDSNADPLAIPLKGIRIGINGRVAEIGQAFSNLDTFIDSSALVDGVQPLSRMGTVIPLEQGPEQDEFFLTFDQLGSNTHTFVEADPGPAFALANLPTEPDIGVRIFDEINATMSRVTGISTENTNVDATFNTIRQQLPTIEAPGAFLSSHQVAIAQLAIEYCDALVESTTARTAFFTSFDFTADVATAFGGADSVQKNQLVDDFYHAMLAFHDPSQGAAVAIATMPTRDQLKDELLVDVLTPAPNIPPLFERMTVSCPAGCDAARSRQIVKALCAASLGSAAMLVQ